MEATASVDFKKQALRKKLTSNANTSKNGNLSSSQRAVLDNAITIKKKQSSSSSSSGGYIPLTEEERKIVKSAEKSIGQQITIKNDRAKFISPTTASNFEKRDSELRTKQQALSEHLKKVEARKTDYKIVKGDYRVESTTSIKKVSSLDVSDKGINQRALNPVSTKNTTITKNTPVTSRSGDSFKTSLKHYTKDFERVAMHSMSQGNDTGSQAVGMTFEVAKTTLVASARLTAINQGIARNSVKVVSSGVQIGKSVYKISANMSLAVASGNIKGTLNIYKNMVFAKVGSTIKYSKPVYVAKNIGQGAKTIAWSTRYKINKTVTLARGLKRGTIKITAKEVRNFAGAKALGAGKLIYKSGKGLNALSRSKIVRGSLRGATNSLKSLGRNSDDMGIQAVGTSLDSINYSFKALKTTGRVATSVGKGAYRTSRGTYRFAKDVRKVGVKGASKLWYNAHLKGAGKKISEKIGDMLMALLKKALCNPAVLGGIALVVCTVVISNTAVISATSVVGGVIEFFEELGEGLKEVWDTVTTAIADFFSSCADWLCSLFGVGDSEPDPTTVDVDIGDSMSICDYLLGAVQLYKAKYALEVGEEYEDLIENEGYHGVMIYNLAGTEMEVHDINDPDKGLMTDKGYVKAILPVWKAIVLGTIGTEFTGKQANNVSKECFDALTEMIEVPYVDIDGDGVADYSYCDGSCSLHEGENTVYTHIGGVVQEGIHSDTGWCYNNSGTLYHTSHNTEGLSCCVTTYWCGGHSRYKCNGHTSTSYCDGGSGCSNQVSSTTYCGGGSSCTNRGSVTTGSTTTYYCKGHSSTSCGGHTSTSYCWSGWSNSNSGCSNYSTENYTCYSGRGTTSHSSCTNEQSEFVCNGYNMCLGHKIMKFYLGSYGFETLLQTRFLDRIAELQAKATLTEEERQELSQLQMYYEYCIGCDANSDPIADEFFETH